MEFQHFNPVDAATVDRFEQKQGVLLPEDYRGFLIDFGGGVFKDSYCLAPGLDEAITIQALYGFSVPGGYDGDHIEYWQNERRLDLKPGEVIIGNDEFGGLLFLNCSKDFSGVYYQDSSCDVDGASEVMLYLISFTFDEFIRGILPFDYSVSKQRRLDRQPIQWPDPLPCDSEAPWPPRKSAIWAPGTKPTCDLSIFPEFIEKSKPYNPPSK